MTNANLNIENVVKLALKIVAECGISMEEAMLLAEFNLTYK